MYPLFLADAVRDGRLIEAEANEQLAVHRLAEGAEWPA